jgi:hypothetical protein
MGPNLWASCSNAKDAVGAFAHDPLSSAVAPTPAVYHQWPQHPGLRLSSANATNKIRDQQDKRPGRLLGIE